VNGKKLHNIEENEEKNVINILVDMYIVNILNRKEHIYEKTDNIDYTCNNIGRM
jgi:hypothetical protein